MSLSADESFATLAQFRTYATARNWAEANSTDYPDATVEGWLREGTDYIVATASWPGVLASTAQVLPVPRTGWVDREGRTLDNTTPTAVVNATIEAARQAQHAPLLGGASTSDPVLIRKKVGELEKEWLPQSQVDSRARALGYVWTLLASVRVHQRAGGSIVSIERA